MLLKPPLGILPVAKQGCATTTVSYAVQESGGSAGGAEPYRVASKTCNPTNRWLGLQPCHARMDTSAPEMDRA